MDRIKTQTANINKKHMEFLTVLKGGQDAPVRFSGKWPASGTEEGEQARTDIAIALVREGFLTFSGGIFRVADRAVQFGPSVYNPGQQVRLTWLDDDRLLEELGDG